MTQNRKKQKGKGEGAKGAAGGTALTTKNLQQMLNKVTIETKEDKKEHKFWDTQPVPKLGQWSGRPALARVIVSSTHAIYLLR